MRGEKQCQDTGISNIYLADEGSAILENVDNSPSWP
jgi:hypothetical protein